MAANIEIRVISTTTYQLTQKASKLLLHNNILCLCYLHEPMKLHIAIHDHAINFKEILTFKEPIQNLAITSAEDTNAYILLIQLNTNLIIRYVTIDNNKFSIEHLSTFSLNKGALICLDKTSQLLVIHSKNSLMLGETFTGTITSRANHTLFETLLSATFLDLYPYILIGIHSNKILSFWDMRDITLITQTILDNTPKEIYTDRDTIVVINGGIEAFTYKMIEEQIMISKRFVYSSEVYNIGLLLEGRNQLLFINKSNSLKLFDLQSYSVVASVNLASQSIGGLCTIIQNEDNTCFIVFTSIDNVLTVKKYELPYIEELKEEIRDDLSSGEELDIEKFIMDPTEDTAVNNMFLNEEVKERKKKRWNCQTTLNMLEEVAPRSNSILIPENIQIKEKTIYDTNTKNISKMSKKGLGKDLSVSNISLLRIDYPVTFHTKIKSSGYGKAPNALKYTSSEKRKKLQKAIPKVAPKKVNIYTQGYPINLSVIYY